jgi:hypothetical protein
VSKKPIKPRNCSSYPLPRHGGTDAWFYTNRGSIDLIVSGAGKTLAYRLRVRDMKEIVRALRSKP